MTEGWVRMAQGRHGKATRKAGKAVELVKEGTYAAMKASPSGIDVSMALSERSWTD